MRAPELEPNKGWINSDRPLSIREDLAGRVVLLEFWTPGRVACDRIVDDLRWLEHKYRDQPFVVVGVCGTERAAEESAEKARHDVRRRGVTHPVVIDDHFKLWRAYQVKQWPTFVLIDPKGTVVGQVAGEGHRMLLDRYVNRLLADGRLDKTLAADRLGVTPEHEDGPESPLRYPAGVLAVAPRVGVPGRVYVSDTMNNRVVAAAWPDEGGRSEVVDVFGGGEGFVDGDPARSRWRSPRGMAFDADQSRLFVADTGNHAVRMIDLKSRVVRTIAGTGEPGGESRGGAVGLTQALRSPGGVALDGGRRRLLIAMAWGHRVWSVDLTTMVTRAIAGTGRCRVVDARADEAMFAQPSAMVMSSDGARVYVADAAGSAVRELDLETQRVRTIIGRARDPDGEDEVLSDSGDVDGRHPDARLAGPVDLSLWATTPMHAAGDRLLVADSRNDKIRLIDPHAGTVETWVEGLARPAGVCVAQPRLGEAASTGVFVADTDRHRVVRFDAETKEMVEVVIVGLPPATT